MNTYSPILGLLTVAFEWAATAWVLHTLYIRKQGDARIWLPAALVLFFLGGYQLMEVIICWGGRESQLMLSRIAFADITWLPPLSILMMARLFQPRSNALFIYARITLVLAAIMTFWILVDYRFITGTICEFMYAKYLYTEPWFHIYGFYYEVTQLSMIVIPILGLIRTNDPALRKRFGDILAGVLLFIIPSFMVGTLIPGVSSLGMPSILCHFALFYAIFLVRMMVRDLREPRLACRA